MKTKKTEYNNNSSSIESIKEVKIKKKKKEKIIDDVVGEIKNANLAPKKRSSNIKMQSEHDVKPKKMIKKMRSIAVKLKDNEESIEVDQKVANNDNKNKIGKHYKKTKEEQKYVQKEAPPIKDVNEAELKKISKKKAKKLAQKLRKKQKKALRQELGKTVVSTTNDTQKQKNFEIDATKNVDAPNNKVLAKKEKKVENKNKLLKEQKFVEKQIRGPANNAATIFVGNLPVNTKRVQLVRLFKNFGPVHSIRFRSASGKVLFKHEQRRLAGTLNAYVVLKNEVKAQKALSLNGVVFKGNHLRVNSAVEKPQGQEAEEAKKTIFVGNLKYTATEESLREIFSSCGEIEYVRCIQDRDNGCKGVAYVCFKTSDGVGLALELNKTIVDDRSINVERFNVKKLGAKEARESEMEKAEKNKLGATRRMKNNQGNLCKKKDVRKEIKGAKKPKKIEFRGVKIQALKKQKSKKKKTNDQMLKLAKKIAPKTN